MINALLDASNSQLILISIILFEVIVLNIMRYLP